MITYVCKNPFRLWFLHLLLRFKVLDLKLKPNFKGLKYNFYEHFVLYEASPFIAQLERIIASLIYALLQRAMIS